jgi:hypothetical protein
MTNLKLVREKVLVHALVVIAAGDIVLWGLCCALITDTYDIIVAAAAAMNITDSNFLLSFD